MEHHYTTIQNFVSCSSYTIDGGIAFDYGGRFDDSSNAVSENSELDQEIYSTFSEDQDDKSILKNFFLDYMKYLLIMMK